MTYVLNYIRAHRRNDNTISVTDPDNIVSIRLMNSVEFRFYRRAARKTTTK